MNEPQTPGERLRDLRIAIDALLVEIDPVPPVNMSAESALARIKLVFEDEREKLRFAQATALACHSAMLGNVNPKNPTWGMVYAVQDQAQQCPDKGATKAELRQALAEITTAFIYGAHEPQDLIDRLRPLMGAAQAVLGKSNT